MNTQQWLSYISEAKFSRFNLSSSLSAVISHTYFYLIITFQPDIGGIKLFLYDFYKSDKQELATLKWFRSGHLRDPNQTGADLSPSGPRKGISYPWASRQLSGKQIVHSA